MYIVEIIKIEQTCSYIIYQTYDVENYITIKLKGVKNFGHRYLLPHKNRVCR